MTRGISVHSWVNWLYNNNDGADIVMETMLNDITYKKKPHPSTWVTCKNNEKRKEERKAN